jgi:DNA-binding transcriptional ArsR family regulator
VDLYDQHAELLKALAHPVRLRILEILAQEESCVCHLTAVLKQRQPYVSQHLMLLREVGLVVDRKEGTIVYYCLTNKRVMESIALTRGLLPNAGAHSDPLPFPRSPVDGCPCPKCKRDGECS